MRKLAVGFGRTAQAKAVEGPPEGCIHRSPLRSRPCFPSLAALHSHSAPAPPRLTRSTAEPGIRCWSYGGVETALAFAPTWASTGWWLPPEERATGSLLRWEEPRHASFA